MMILVKKTRSPKQPGKLGIIVFCYTIKLHFLIKLDSRGVFIIATTNSASTSRATINRATTQD